MKLKLAKPAFLRTKPLFFLKVLVLLSSLLITGHLRAQDYSKDIKMGEKAAKQVEQEMGFYKHDSLERMVKSIGKKLVGALKEKPQGFEFQFFLVDAEEPNAFALPGGYIYVTRGILPLIQTEDELAGIIGHEIIHVVNRHSVRQFKREIVPAVLKIPGNIINAITFSHLGNILNVPIELITYPFIAKYSRKHERQSDEQGIELAARAGYDPAQLANALARLSKEVEVLTGNKERRSYYSDHPYTPHRVEDISELSKKLSPAKSAPLYLSNEKFLQNFNDLCFGHNPRNGDFVDSVLFVHPDLGFAMSMPASWDKENTSSLVTAHHKDHNAAVALSIVPDKKSAKECGTEMQKKLKQSSTTVLECSRDTTINNLSAYLIRVRTKKKGQEVVLEVAWIEHNRVVYQIEGVCVAEKRKATAESIRSFKPATSADRSKVMIHELKLVQAQNGESIEELSKRTENKLNPQLTLIFNDLEKSAKLSQYKAVKIVSKQAYKP